MWGLFESADLLVSSAAPSSTVHHLVSLSVNCSGASWYQGRLVMLPPPGSTSIKAPGFVVLSLLIRFHQHFFSAHQHNSLLKFSSSLFHIIMRRAPSSTRRASVVADPQLTSPYPLQSRHLCTLANPPTLEQPLFAGRRGQPIVIDNPAPDAPPAKLPAFINIPAPPGLGSPMFRPQTPRPGLDSPVFRPKTPHPANLDSPVFSSDKENPFVNQLASPVYQAGSPTHPLPNGDDPLDPAPEYNLPPIPAPYPAVETYPFTDFSPVPTPEPRGFFDPAVFHGLNDQQIEDLLKRQHEPGRFNRYAFGPHHFTGFYQSISSYYVQLYNQVPPSTPAERAMRFEFFCFMAGRYHSFDHMVL
ncbi:hypothetical protein PCANC_10564 [Puccinia coronata f. sp. avenae]|uniref:Uncharacterized protein n=1 Tax=Puccinia coronata f. sp. avenae TaxID=200324 RepID=A0A2N5VZ82_9BASI|nr:hypothetical protein PCANC_10564 [Puccinia coronata f. sp. avenae]